MDINLELYKAFYYVAKNLSFSEASNDLYISQSAVSQAIRTLEEKIECKLFIRNTKQVKLTQEGEILYKHLEQAFNFIKAGERSVAEIRSLEQGELRIGASDTICKYHLLPYLKKFNALYPNIKIHVTNRPSPRCIELLTKGSVDVSVVNLLGDLNKGKNLEVIRIAEIEDNFIAGNNFKHLSSKKLTLKDLENYPILMLEKNSTTRKFIDAFLTKKGVNLTPEIELGSMDLLIDLAKIGLGISFVVGNYIDQRDIDNGEIFVLKLEEKLPTRSIGIMTNKNIPTAIAAKKFIELITG